MPAASLAVDWEAIKAHAIIHGVRPAARHFGIKEDTVKRRCTREGWVKPQTQVVPQLPATMQKIAVPNVPTPSEAAKIALAEDSKRTRIGLAKGIRRAAETVGDMDGDTVLAAAQSVKQLVDSADKLHGWSQDVANGRGQTFAIDLRISRGPEPVMIDVESEVVEHSDSDDSQM